MWIKLRRLESSWQHWWKRMSTSCINFYFYYHHLRKTCANMKVYLIHTEKIIQTLSMRSLQAKPLANATTFLSVWNTQNNSLLKTTSRSSLNGGTLTHTTTTAAAFTYLALSSAVSWSYAYGLLFAFPSLTSPDLNEIFPSRMFEWASIKNNELTSTQQNTNVI